MSKRVLVTGAGGVLGRALLERLRRGPLEIVSLNSRLDCDLERYEEVRRVFNTVRPDVVMHLAGAVYGLGGNLAFPGDIMTRNLAINLNVVRAAREAGTLRIVAMGSTAMYPDGVALPMIEVDALAGVPHSSERFYGYAKRIMAMHLESLRLQFGLSYSVAVCTNIYGPGDRFDPVHGHVVPSLIHKFAQAERNGDVVEVWGDGTPTRDFIYSGDAAHGLEVLLNEGEGLFNLATGRSHSIRDLLELIQSFFPSVAVRWDPSKPNGQLRRSYDVSRLSALGFKADTDLRSGLQETISWYRTSTNHRAASSVPQETA